MSEQRLVVLALDEGDGPVFQHLLAVPTDLDLAAVKQERKRWYWETYMPSIRNSTTVPTVEYRDLLDFLKEKGCVVVPVEVFYE